MNSLSEVLFRPLPLRHLVLPNRLIRSATYEGMADAEGNPTDAIGPLYRALLKGGVGTVITGFMYTSQEGHALQSRQCGMDSSIRIIPWRSILAAARIGYPDGKIIAQIAHAGRQTHSRFSGQPIVGAGRCACTYFRDRPRTLSTDEVADRAEQLGRSACYIREAGFDGVQIHAAHGYLIHQFLSPWTNRRADEWTDPNRFLLAVVDAVRRHAGSEFPVLVKLSWSEDRKPGIGLSETAATVRALDGAGVDAVEISYGTMEWPMNIMRGDCPLKVAARISPILSRYPSWLRRAYLATAGRLHLRRLIPFSPCYNASAAAEIQRYVRLAVIPVGGIRSSEDIAHCMLDLGLPAVSLCRALIRNPDFPLELSSGKPARSRCTNCNLCTVYCESTNPLRCYARTGNSERSYLTP